MQKVPAKDIYINCYRGVEEEVEEMSLGWSQSFMVEEALEIYKELFNINW